MQTAPIAICSKIFESVQSLILSQSSFSLLFKAPPGDDTIRDELTKSEREGTNAANGFVLFAMDSAVISFAVVVGTVVISVIFNVVVEIPISGLLSGYNIIGSVDIGCRSGNVVVVELFVVVVVVVVVVDVVVRGNVVVVCFMVVCLLAIVGLGVVVVVVRVVVVA